ncbi:MAG: fasciclin domain-containing protein, partial [Deinococcales bacterium]
MLLGAGAALALTLGMAFAQPSIQLDGLNTQASGLAAYLQNHAAGSSNGFCFQDNANRNQTGYACFEHALQVSGLASMVNSSKPITVFAPTDAAFAHLESTTGLGVFEQFMNDKAAMTQLVKSSIVDGSHTVSDLAYQAPVASGSTSLTTVAGTPLDIV